MGRVADSDGQTIYDPISREEISAEKKRRPSSSYMNSLAISKNLTNILFPI